MKSKFMIRIWSWLPLFCIIVFISGVNDATAHPGHADPVTISRSSHLYMQNIIPHYLKIYKVLVSDQFENEHSTAASKIRKIMKQAAGKEKEASGKKLFKKVADSADFLSGAESVKPAREEFSDLNDNLLPFFHSWPGHIKEHDLVLFTCPSSKKWWLQKKGEPINPYEIGGKLNCKDLTKKEE